MSCGSLEKLLTEISQGSISVADGLNLLRENPVLDLGHTKFDLQRPARNGFPEVVYGEGKTPEQVRKNVQAAGLRIPEDMRQRLADVPGFVY